ncbi:hypothetical protein HYH03_013485 [Edaphochlamys debaryana]|uniref:Rab-GAP TBC domain-containing protein n=1 Tax=Edaphochlamys debaryana TaxID=47281 RepID=A0A835XQQ8_9CHLO|nr:hypothetical protein HYH03_013485 [Edaphochlamys debaryana]|eukprot:KAG2487905.1 hypothetical protein HYH03_013485 [Edaphochlamys debaryana]
MGSATGARVLAMLQPSRSSSALLGAAAAPSGPPTRPGASSPHADGYDALLDGLSGSELKTATLVVEALRSPEDLSRLRRLAVTHGFVNDRIRAVVWPRLLGVTPPAVGNAGSGLALGQPPSRTPSGRAPSSSDATPLRQGTDGSASSPTRSGPGLGPCGSTASPRPGAAGPAPNGHAQAPERQAGATGRSPASRSSMDGAAASPPGSGAGSGSPPGLGSGGPGSTQRQRSRRSSASDGGAHGSGTADPAAPAASTPDPDAIPHIPADAPSRRNGSSSTAAASDLAPGEEEAWRQYLAWASTPHRDSSVVEVDVARSLWSFTRGQTEEVREARRAQLKRLLNAVVGAHPDDVYYYQGLHDVAGVLVMAMATLPDPLPSPAPPVEASAPAPAEAAVSASASGRGPESPARGHGAPASPGRGSGLASAAHAQSAGAVCNGESPAGGGGGAEGGSLSAAAVAPAASETQGSHSAAAAASPGADPHAEELVAADPHGELLAFSLLRRLATTHLRDATRPTLQPVAQLLGLLPYVVRAADPQITTHINALGLQPFFALSWFLTWWSRELDDLASASRLFDFFLASHPLMPLYLGAVAMRSQREALLACEEMPELHSALANLKLTPGGAGKGPGGGSTGGSGDGNGPGPGADRRLSISSSGRFGSGRGARAGPSLDFLMAEAEKLWRACPPHALLASRPVPRAPPPPSQTQLRRRRGGASAADAAAPPAPLDLTACVAHAARLSGHHGPWLVPSEAPAEWPDPSELGLPAGGSRSPLARVWGALAGGGRSRLSVVMVAGVYVAAVVAVGYATLSRSMDPHRV